MTRYVKFVVSNGYFGQPDESDPTPFDELGLKPGADLRDPRIEKDLDRQAEDFMWGSAYAPEYRWVECDEDGEEVQS